MAIIGGGVVGCAVTHALLRRGVAAVLFEAQERLGTGASATNSGILHTGFDSHPGELETRLILRAVELREELLGELGVEVWHGGALLAPRDDGERNAVGELAENARRNGVEAVLGDDGSLEVPGEAVCNPLAFVTALADAAHAGGAEVRLGAPVAALAPADGDTLEVMLASGERLRASAVVNCAGLYADEIAEMGGERPFEIYPRKGEFLVFEAPPSEPLEQILLPVPSALGKGVLVFPTLDRRHVIAGPTARERSDKEDWSVEPDARELILERARAIYPPLADARVIDTYAGLRPAGRDGRNYVIERSRTLPGLVHVAAIRSTGLSASLAIGEHVVGMLAEDGLFEPGPVRALPVAPRASPSPTEWWRWGAAHRSPRTRTPEDDQ